MEPICILEQYRLDPIRGERTAVYTLVEHPFRPNSSREISVEEAVKFIKERKLVRRTQVGREDGDGEYVLGYVWDTLRRAFQKKWSVTDYAKRRRKICLLRRDLAPVATRKVKNYRRLIQTAIETNLNQE